MLRQGVACRGAPQPTILTACAYLLSYLLDEASWATQGCAPLFRSAITFAARRALAAGIRRSTCTAAEARFAERTDWLGPDPARCFDCPVDPAPAEQ